MPAANERPFHSRIFRIYLEYLRVRLHWGEVRIEEFLKSIETSRERLEDESSWFDVEFADRFYYRLREVTEDSELAYHAGLFVNQKALSPIFHQMLRGLMNISFLYRLIAKFSSYYSKAAHFHVISVDNGAAQLEVTNSAGFRERPYMCENRRGILSGLPTIFGLPAAEIHEPECQHRGGVKCRYQLKWQASEKWILIARDCAIVLSIAGLIGKFTLWALGLNALIMGALVLSALEFRKRYTLHREELLAQNEALDETLRQLERKNHELALVNQVAQLTHSLTNPDDLAKTLVRSVCEILNYDRAILLLVDPAKQVLNVGAFYGFDSKLQEMLSQAEFNIRSENSDGFFIRVVNTNSPILISDVEAQLTKLSVRSQKFAKILGSKSFVAVPLTNEIKEVIGVLSVDNVRFDKTIRITDQDLLMTLAEHLGIALHNTKILRQLEDNLKATEQVLDQQKILRQTFQKFVPSDLAEELTKVSSKELYQQRISQVRNRPAAILFLDIFSFSKIAEALRPEDVVDLLNTAFEILEPVVSKYQGFVDKFTGDGLIAIFENSESCVRICECAIEIMNSLSTVNQRLAAKGYPAIQIGIGMNYGDVILGNIGSSDRLNFTVIGEAVNLASRLESHTRVLGPNTICASASIRARAGDLLTWEELGQIQVKGYAESPHAFRLKVGSTNERHVHSATPRHSLN